MKNKLITKIPKDIMAQKLILIGIIILTIVLFRVFYDLLKPLEVPSVISGATFLRLENVFGSFSTFFSFTNYSNIFLGLSIAIIGFNWHKQAKWHFNFLFFAVVVISITFVIFWGVISWSNLGKWTTHTFDMILSLLVHAFSPILGFVTLWILRQKVEVNWKTIFAASGYVFGYFTLALIIYLITKATTTSQLPVVIYRFLNFERPLFYKGGKLGAIVVLDILMLLIGALIPLGLAFFWKGVYRLKLAKFPFKKLKGLSKVQSN